jgi:hypothetical protein
VLVADAAAVDVADACREDRQGTFYGFYVVVFPVELGAAVGYLVALEKPDWLTRPGSFEHSR